MISDLKRTRLGLYRNLERLKMSSKEAKNFVIRTLESIRRLQREGR